MNRRIHPPRHGMFLIEMIAVMFLLTVFAGVAYELCASSLRMNTHIDERLNSLASHDAAIRQLRRDVWESMRIKLGGGSLQLSTPDQIITWHAEGDDLHETTPDGADRRWPGCGDVTFAVAGDTVIARADTAPNRQSEEFRLASEQQLLGAEAP